MGPPCGGALNQPFSRTVFLVRAHDPYPRFPGWGAGPPPQGAPNGAAAGGANPSIRPPARIGKGPSAREPAASVPLVCVCVCVVCVCSSVCVCSKRASILVDLNVTPHAPEPERERGGEQKTGVMFSSSDLMPDPEREPSPELDLSSLKRKSPTTVQLSPSTTSCLASGDDDVPPSSELLDSNLSERKRARTPPPEASVNCAFTSCDLNHSMPATIRPTYQRFDALGATIESHAESQHGCQREWSARAHQLFLSALELHGKEEAPWRRIADHMQELGTFTEEDMKQHAKDYHGQLQAVSFSGLIIKYFPACDS